MWGTVAAAPDVNDLIGFLQNPKILLGIPLALAGAVFMSLGTQYQHRGVAKVEKLSGQDAAAGLSRGQLGQLLTRPSWIVGTLMLGLAIVCQLAAIWLAPLIVVQPLGAVALVITTLLNARITGFTPTRQSLIAIGLCVGGTFLFVFLAAMYAEDKPVTDAQLGTVLSILLVVIIVLGGLWVLLRNRMKALFYIMGAGIIYGFVATLAKVVLKRIQEQDFEWLTLVCLIALVAGTLLGGYFVQTAHASGPPDLVIAGLTVVDPIVAVLIGLLVLGEATSAPTWIYVGFGIAGAIATFGVVALTRYHPQVIEESQELPIQRGSGGEPSASVPSSPQPTGPAVSFDAPDAADLPSTDDLVENASDPGIAADPAPRPVAGSHDRPFPHSDH
ncbi:MULTISPECIES: DMT family transporter [Microbacterium]|uniref:DMT family transporter n=1 Tax=Microbacterium TaxID=33882 RepID=UPI001E48F1D1|nr:DMT family transporter [Microbacterium nymphoidis]MCD2497573.1 multidrug DMT transporter permease [Microbacterium nymphoidis]